LQMSKATAEIGSGGDPCHCVIMSWEGIPNGYLIDNVVVGNECLR